MDCWSFWFILANLFFILITSNLGQIRTVDAQQDERIRLECTVTSKLDAEEAMWMRIRPPHNPDILTYRDSVVFSPDRIQLEQRRLSSSINANGTLIDTYFITLTILRPNIDDEGRYICARPQKQIFAEYDLFIIVPPHFVDNNNNFIQQPTVIEGSSLHLSCSADGRPKPSITWFSRTTDGKLLALNNGTACQESVCELHLANYTRNDPTVIECIAENGKSTRISKVFHVDVHYPPKIITNLRTFTGMRTIDVHLQCSSISNPPGSVLWLDDHRQPIRDTSIFSVKTLNQTSDLSFTVSPEDQPMVIYYCRSNNSVGTDEKLIDVSNLIVFDSIIIRETTTIGTSTITKIDENLQFGSSFPTTRNASLHRRTKTMRPTRARSRHPTSTTVTITTTTSASNSLITFSSSVFLFDFIFVLWFFCFV